MKRRIFLLALFAWLLAACGRDSQLQVSDIWGRPSPMSAPNSAFYMTIENTGEAADTLLRSESGACGAAELHESILDTNGIMGMHPVAAIQIPAGETLSLEPGGLHIMCLDRQQDLTPGTVIPLTLVFETAGALEVEVEIREE